MAVPVTVIAVLIALGGAVSARIGGAPFGRATLRVIAGGAVSLAYTYAIDNVIGAALT